jgi:hypothetical protein
MGTGFALTAALSGPAAAAPADTPAGVRAKRPAAYLIYLIDAGDPIVVSKYVEEGGQIRFEKYGGWVGIPSYEVLRIVPDESEDSDATLPPATKPGDGTASLYVATRDGATVKASAVGATGNEVRVSTPEGSLTFHRADLLGVVRVPAAPAAPEAWITLWGANDGPGVARPAAAQVVPPPHAPVPMPTLTDRPHLLQLASGVVFQVDGFWLEAGEIRFRRLGGVVGVALGEIARLLPQEVGPLQGRLAARFVRQLGPDRMEVRLGRGLERIRLIGVDPVVSDRELEDPWAGLEKEHPVRLEFDRERYAPDGTWLAYVYLPNGRMLNAELIRVGLARPRAEAQNVRYLDLFEELTRQSPPRSPAP